MWDDPPVRHRVDQPGEEFADYRRFHDWSDIEVSGDEPETPPEPVQEPPRAALHLVTEEEAQEPEIAAPEATQISVAAGLRLLARQLAELLDRQADE